MIVMTKIITTEGVDVTTENGLRGGGGGGDIFWIGMERLIRRRKALKIET